MLNRIQPPVLWGAGVLAIAGCLACVALWPQPSVKIERVPYTPPLPEAQPIAEGSGKVATQEPAAEVPPAAKPDAEDAKAGAVGSNAALTKSARRAAPQADDVDTLVRRMEQFLREAPEPGTDVPQP